MVVGERHDFSRMVNEQRMFRVHAIQQLKQIVMHPLNIQGNGKVFVNDPKKERFT